MPGLGEGVGGAPDAQLLAQGRGDARGSDVLLAQVHAVGICGKCYVDPVIDDDTAPMRSCHVDQPAGSVDEDSIGKILLT